MYQIKKKSSYFLVNAFNKYLSPEQRLHVSVCHYLDLKHREAFYFHAHNEAKRTPFERYLAKAMRLRPGLPDLMLPLGKGQYTGLGIELKIKPNKLTENQKCVGKKLQEQGWRVEVCYDFNQAREVVDEYLKKSDDYDGNA